MREGNDQLLQPRGACSATRCTGGNGCIAVHPRGAPQCPAAQVKTPVGAGEGHGAACPPSLQSLDRLAGLRHAGHAVQRGARAGTDVSRYIRAGHRSAPQPRSEPPSGRGRFTARRALPLSTRSARGPSGPSMGDPVNPLAGGSCQRGPRTHPPPSPPPPPAGARCAVVGARPSPRHFASGPAYTRGTTNDKQSGSVPHWSAPLSHPNRLYTYPHSLGTALQRGSSDSQRSR